MSRSRHTEAQIITALKQRMLCKSIFLFDKPTHPSPKIQEFREIMTDFVVGEERKVVVVSEFERITHLAAGELRKLGIGLVSLHGGVPSRNRSALIEQFRNDPACNRRLLRNADFVRFLFAHSLS